MLNKSFFLLIKGETMAKTKKNIQSIYNTVHLVDDEQKMEL